MRYLEAEQEQVPAVGADEYDAERDLAESINEAYRAIRERIANGGPRWVPRTNKPA
jgi:hypothetical protein